MNNGESRPSDNLPNNDSKQYDDTVKKFLELSTNSEKQKQYKQLMKLTWKTCEELLQQLDIKGLVQGRIKTKKSLRKKLEDLKNERTQTADSSGPKKVPNFKEWVLNGESIYDHPDMGDLVGIRIGVYFPDDISRVAKEIEREFYTRWLFGTVTGGRRVAQDRNVDIQGHVNGPWHSLGHGTVEYWEHYGYKSWQVVVDWKPPPVEIERSTVEIQVGTVVTQAWAEVQHDIIYKRPPLILATPTMKRMIDAINGLAITTDIMIMELERSLKEAEEEVNRQPFKNGAKLLKWFELSYLSLMERDEREKWRQAQNENEADMLIDSYEVEGVFGDKGERIAACPEEFKRRMESSGWLQLGVLKREYLDKDVSDKLWALVGRWRSLPVPLEKSSAKEKRKRKRAIEAGGDRGTANDSSDNERAFKRRYFEA